MKTILLAAAALTLTATLGTAHAQRHSKVDGSQLLRFCTSTSTEGCDGYLSGVADAFAVNGQGRNGVCIPMAVTGVQLRKVMVTFLHDHPQDLQKPAGELTIRAYTSVFPCH